MPVTTSEVPSGNIGAIPIRRVGRLIRRTNLDELPQLWNVVKGEMSLIGPRPSLPSETELIRQRQRNGALRCRPGLTGWAQVNSYDGMSTEHKAELDGVYVAQMSFAMEALIMFKTLGYLMRPPPKY